MASIAPTNVQTSVDYLAQLRSRNLRKSEDVLIHGEYLFGQLETKLSNRLGDTCQSTTHTTALAFSYAVLNRLGFPSTSGYSGARPK